MTNIQETSGAGMTSVLEGKRIKDISSTCCVGDNGLRLVGLLKSETAARLKPRQ